MASIIYSLGTCLVWLCFSCIVCKPLSLNDLFIYWFSLEKEILDRYLEVVLKGNKDGLKVRSGPCVLYLRKRNNYCMLNVCLNDLNSTICLNPYLVGVSYVDLLPPFSFL